MAGYGDDAGLTAWLAENGLTLPAVAPAAAVLRQRGSDYLDALYGDRFVGEPAEGHAQERAWPRTGAIVGVLAVPPDVVPDAVTRASYRAAYQEALEPGSLSVLIVAAQRVIREKVEGAVEVQYSDKGDSVTASTPIISIIDGMMRPYLLRDIRIGLLAVG